jgi:hypothetical protein
MVEHVGQRGRRLQDIVYRAEQGRVRHNGDRRGFDRGLHDGDVVPPVPRDSLSGQRSHLRRLIDPDDHTGAAHPVSQTFEAQAGPAAHIEHNIADSQRECVDDPQPVTLEGSRPAVVELGVAPV